MFSFNFLIISVCLAQAFAEKQLIIKNEEEIYVNGQLDGERIRREAKLINTTTRPKEGCEYLTETDDTFLILVQSEGEEEPGEGIVTLTSLSENHYESELLLRNSETQEDENVFVPFRAAMNCLAQDDPELFEKLKSDCMSPPSHLPYSFAKNPPDLLGENMNALILSSAIFKGNVENGFFIDVGANDFELFSKTLLLEMHSGWEGLLIEPHTLDYRKGLKTNRKAWSINSCLLTEKKQDVKGLQCFSLYTFSRTFNRTVNLLTMYLEQSAMEVLQTLPWDKVDIEVISLESHYQEIVFDGSTQQIREFLQQKGYVYVDMLYHEDLYIRKDLYEGAYAPDKNVYEGIKAMSTETIVAHIHQEKELNIGNLRSWLGQKTEL